MKNNCLNPCSSFPSPEFPVFGNSGEAGWGSGVAARASCRVHRDIEALRGQMSEAGQHPGQEHAGAGVALSLSKRVEGLFESLLAEAFSN
jgi:hypothetical protein